MNHRIVLLALMIPFASANAMAGARPRAGSSAAAPRNGGGAAREGRGLKPTEAYCSEGLRRTSSRSPDTTSTSIVVPPRDSVTGMRSPALPCAHTSR